MFRLLANSDRATACGPLTWKTWTGIVTVALIVASLLSWAFWSPTSNRGTARAAVVNNDKPVTVQGRTVPLGRQLAGDLVHSDTSPYDWVLTDADDAADGLADGRYAATVTIPAAFSRQATSTATATPLKATAGKLSIETSGNAGLADPLASRDVAKAMTASLGRQVVQTYLDNTYVGFTTIHNQMGKAADGADRLSTGADKVVTGAGRLEAGAGRLADGTGRLATGTGRLSDGMAQLRQRTAVLPGQTKALASGARQVADGNRRLADTVVPIANRIVTVVDALPSAEAGAQKVQRLTEQCRVNGGTPEYCARLAQATDDLVGDAATIDHGRNTVRAKTVQARDNVRALSTGSGQVAAGAARLAAATPSLTSAIATAADAAQQVDEGARGVDAGARQLDDGAHSLHTATKRLAGGSHSLASSLAKGRDQVPSYTSAEREHLKRVAATPIVPQVFGPSGFGASSAAFVVVLGLWACALATYLVIRAVPPIVRTSRAPTWRIIVTAAAPGATVAALTALVLSLVLAPWLHLGIGRWFAFLLVTLLAAGAFIAVNQTLVAIFKRPGRFASIAVLVLTVAAGVISSVPGMFVTVMPYLPTHGAIVALRAIVTGGSGALSGTAELVVWLAMGIIATITVTERRRLVPSRELRLPRSRKTGALTGV
jgi:putative membrane protein